MQLYHWAYRKGGTQPSAYAKGGRRAATLTDSHWLTTVQKTKGSHPAAAQSSPLFIADPGHLTPVERDRRNTHLGAGILHLTAVDDVN